MMNCQYRDEGQCRVNHQSCPWVYWCVKQNLWREVNGCPDECKVASDYELPKGTYRVEFERHGYLYVHVDNAVIKVENIYDCTPLFVKLTKQKDGKYRIKKESKG